MLREIISCLRKKYSKSEDAVAITASTGIAACNIGGVTLHSFSGIGLGLESPSELATKVRRNKKASTRWIRTKVLLIDESKRKLFNHDLRFDPKLPFSLSFHG